MVLNQAYLFLIFIMNGIIIGFLFDFFRILRKSFNTSDIITYIEDVIFWILTGIILLYSIFTFNNGEIRLFMFLSVFIGVLIYMLLFSSHIIKINVKIIVFIKKIVLKLLNILGAPIKIIYKFIKKVFCKPVSFITINIRKISTNLYNKLYNSIKNSKNPIKNNQ